MSVIRLTVDGQKLIPIEKPLIASQGVVEDSVIFDFSSEWDGYGKVALFWRAEDEQRENIYEVMVNENNTALVPWEVTQTDGEICITVFGTQDTSVITAEIIRYKIVEGLYSEGQGSEPPTPDIYQQILAIAGEVNGKFETAIDDIAVIDSRVDQIVAHQTNFNDGKTYRSFYMNKTFAVGDTEIIVNKELYRDDFGDSQNDDIQVVSAVLYLPQWNAVTEFPAIASLPQNYKDEISPVFKTQYPVTWAVVFGEEIVLSSQTFTPINFYAKASGFSVTQAGVGGILMTVSYDAHTDLDELTDIRVGADSTTYQSAGAAVRAQVDDLQDQIDELKG